MNLGTKKYSSAFLCVKMKTKSNRPIKPHQHLAPPKHLCSKLTDERESKLETRSPDRAQLRAEDHGGGGGGGGGGVISSVLSVRMITDGAHGPKIQRRRVHSLLITKFVPVQ